MKASDSLAELEKLYALNPNRFLVADLKGGAGDSQIIGAVLGAFDGRRAWIYHLAVLPRVRRAGVGKLLMRETERHLRAEGALKAKLSVEPENEAAAHLFESMGYSEVPFMFLHGIFATEEA